ncbi:MAG: methyltransferase domain-containing protein [Candidatus Hydrogenedentes bacterium]|nr:methyltransferase domain-containing protein [Candidatus Hydrogenedentota bacterium]
MAHVQGRPKSIRAKQKTATSCPACMSTRLVRFFDMPDVPVHVGVQWPDRESALGCPRGSVRLAFCQSCGCVTNTAFDPRLVKYTEEYDNTLFFSKVYRDYAIALAKQLVDRYDLHEKDIIEIGCGKGEFLLHLCELGGNRGIGFDPSFEQHRVKTDIGDRCRFISDLYTERYADLPADFICFSFVLEHIAQPLDFLRLLRVNIGNKPSRTVLFCAVPNGELIFRDMRVWDIIYEHSVYFTEAALFRMFTACGFDVREVSNKFGNQYLCVEAVAFPIKPLFSHLDMSGARMMRQSIETFRSRFENKCTQWQRLLDSWAGAGRRVALWGAGAKAVCFLNVLDIAHSIEYAVDINPHKQGKYLPGTAQPIVAPEFMSEYRPDVVIVMNPMYRKEIKHILDRFGLCPELVDA